MEEQQKILKLSPSAFWGSQSQQIKEALPDSDETSNSTSEEKEDKEPKGEEEDNEENKEPKLKKSSFRTAQSVSLHEETEDESNTEWPGIFLLHVYMSKPFVECPTIIYATRTHSQLAQVIKELKNTDYK